MKVAQNKTRALSTGFSGEGANAALLASSPASQAVNQFIDLPMTYLLSLWNLLVILFGWPHK